MELSSNVISAKVQRHASGVFSATAGQSFEIDIDGEKKLNVEVPEGKNWEAISISINIDEVDA